MMTIWTNNHNFPCFPFFSLNPDLLTIIGLIGVTALTTAHN